MIKYDSLPVEWFLCLSSFCFGAFLCTEEYAKSPVGLKGSVAVFSVFLFIAVLRMIGILLKNTSIRSGTCYISGMLWTSAGIISLNIPAINPIPFFSIPAIVANVYVILHLAREEGWKDVHERGVTLPSVSSKIMEDTENKSN